MQTNQVMTREDGFIQRTKDNYFNANILVDYWNSKNLGNKKVLGNFNSIQSTKEFIEQLKKEGIDNPIIAGRGSGENAGTWMHPKLFIDLAMWLSVEFKSKVIDMVLDGLIISRNEAGDYYKEMSAVIMEKYVEHFNNKPPSMLYINEANMIREISNTKGKERNEMTEKELALITNLQKINAQLISKNVGKESRVKQLTMISTALSAEIGSRK
jgi:hypothetical protein